VSCSGEHRIGGSLEKAGLLCASFGGSWAHIADAPPSQKKSRFGNHTGQTFSTLTRFIKNTRNIYISK
jgi:hypothetical protein